MTFFIFLIYFAHFVAVDAKDQINSSYNMRQQNLAKLIIRGKIYSNRGEILAEQALDKNGNEVRYYPYHELFCHAVGISSHGGIGVEKSGNITLLTSDSPPAEKLEKEMYGVRNYGDDIYTTFDMKLQKAASDALGVYKGAIIAMEPKTGRILAMVSRPDFDPNTVSENWALLSQDNARSPLLNRATQGLYPPGSTFKIVTLLQYLREHNEDYKDYRYNCKGHFDLEDVRIDCYHGSVHGRVDLRSSFAKSCNSSFAYMGSILSINRFHKTCEGLLFNKNLPLDLPTSKSSYTLSNDSDTEERLQSAIGQGKVLMTPMHLCMLTSCIANDGILMVPYEIDKYTNYLGAVISETEPKKYGRLMSEEEAARLKDYMAEVVKTGTGKKLNGLNYTVAGKTGSAEYGSVKGDSHAWFTGFSNIEDPELVVTIIMEGAGSGGDYAVPMAKRVFDAYYSS
ncbi:MAG: penicillin-binding protein 2 [Lachnospiraceae bacterium]|nr:penicillin-binding protein 2 [Lachnospiraceae bacterium]